MEKFKVGPDWTVVCEQCSWQESYQTRELASGIHGKAQAHARTVGHRVVITRQEEWIYDGS